MTLFKTKFNKGRSVLETYLREGHSDGPATDGEGYPAYLRGIIEQYETMKRAAETSIVPSASQNNRKVTDKILSGYQPMGEDPSGPERDSTRDTNRRNGILLAVRDKTGGPVITSSASSGDSDSDDGKKKKKKSTKKKTRKHSSVEDNIASKNKMVDAIDSLVNSQGDKSNERRDENDRKYQFFGEAIKTQNEAKKQKYELQNNQFEKSFAFKTSLATLELLKEARNDALKEVNEQSDPTVKELLLESFKVANAMYLEKLKASSEK